MIPYYMFIARDTGAREYFEIPLAQCLDIYQGAGKQASGLGHRSWPINVEWPRKDLCLGRETIAGEDVCIKVLARAK